MEALKGWALAVCVAAVAGSLVYLVAPAGNTQKALRLTVSVFFLCAVFAPVLTGTLRGDFDLPHVPDLPLKTTTAIEEQMHAQAEEAFVQSVEDLTRQALEEIEVKPEKIAVAVHTDEEDGISITELRLALSPEDQSKQAKVQTWIEKTLGLKPVLEAAGGT